VRLENEGEMRYNELDWLIGGEEVKSRQVQYVYMFRAERSVMRVIMWRVTCVFVVIMFSGASLEAGTYYVATTGNNSNPGTEVEPWLTIQKAANTLNAGDTVLIRQGTYSERVSMNRSGLPGAPITFANYPGEEPTIDAATTSWGEGAFKIRDCSHIAVSGLAVTSAARSGMSGFWTWEVNDLRIEGCHTYNTGSSGMKINYSYNVVITGNEVESACQAGGEEDISIKLHSDGVVVSYNHIHHGNHEGIDIKEGARNVEVIGNYIHDIERQGLYADAWNVPTFNIVYRDNIIHDCGFGLGACAETSGQLSNVWFVNNLVYNCDGPGMFCKDWGGDANDTHPMLNVYYVNNTVYNCAWGWGAGMDIGNYEAENVVVRNNIISNCGVYINVSRPPISYTIEYNLAENITGLDPNWCIQGLPAFVDASAGDFRLLADSNAIDTGTDTNAPAVDIDGDPRPQAGGYDIGAYEWPLGDINGNGILDFVDFSILAAQWRQSPLSPSADIAPAGGDDIVDWLDLAELTRSWPK